MSEPTGSDPPGRAGAAALPVYEKLGVFYLGREWSPQGAGAEAAPAAAAPPLLYDSRDLTTHALCVGMTGSGKTGLCLGLLEEAALDGVPVIAIDPKGDLGNLLLTFPDLAPADFAPWVDPEAARREGISVEEHAARVAERWRRGLAEWDQSGERIRRLREAADFRIYTPGSTAGRPLSVLASFAAPPEGARDPADDLFRERVQTVAASLLALVGIDGDPLTSREHILLALIFEHAWSAGRDLDLGELVRSVQSPPVAQVGVMPLDTFYPPDERFRLAMRLNHLLASPGFAAWRQGEPLDVDGLLWGPDGRPRVSVLSIAHLSEAERMFFVSLLLNEVLGWTRGLSGTGSLRAVIYMDEVFGYFPPVAEPPSKRPLLTLLKQARAYGVGVVLATQNPVDLDYRGLGNIGTWFLGRLQTERDKQRLLDGLEAAGGGAALHRAEIDRLLSALPQRVFLMRNVHDAEPVVFQTRWAMSYLAGPMTRDQIRRLTDHQGPTEQQPATATPGVAAETRPAVPSSRPPPPGSHFAAETPPGAPSARPPGEPGAAAAMRSAPPPAPLPARHVAAESSAGPPVLPPDVPQAWVRPTAVGGDAGGVYHPHLLAFARVHFVDQRRGIDHGESVVLLAPLAGPSDPDWHGAREVDLADADLERQPPPGVAHAPAPARAADPKSYRSWEKELADVLYRGRRLELSTSPTTGVVAAPGETERELRIRLTERLHEERDRAVDTLRERYERRIATKAEQVRRAEQAVAREEDQAKGQKWAALGSAATTAFGVFFGRKRLSATTLRRVGTAARSFTRSGKEAADVERAAETLEIRRRELADLEAELEKELAELAEKYAPENERLETVTVKPRRTDVEIQRLLLAWVPG
ncbi:MAG TPA: DUF87 domain-containing protein [Thermoanaerobaculia bacterium]|nr:DUF87 domain-containing protein [Thermoanaerobaculia bacterium]